MDFKVMLAIGLLSLYWSQVSSIPLATGTSKEILLESTNTDDDTVVVEVSTNEIVEKDGNLIDLSSYGRLLYGQPDFNKTGRLVAEFEPNTNSVNPEELGSYLEGDILMPQKSFILRNGLTSQTSRWPHGVVPYEIAGQFRKQELEMIANAIDEYHSKTCVRFIPRTTESDYISIVRGKSGCWSAIGRVGGKQEVNLQAPGCLSKPGTAMHELMHVLGFLHEQNRQERDSFVTIQYQNIQDNAVPNFKRTPRTAAFGVAYDYGSVMHYSAYAFSLNGQPTIVPKQPEGGYIMGQRDGFSPLDIEKVNRMYNCLENSKRVEPPVQLPVAPPIFVPFSAGLVTNPIGNFFGNIFNRLNKVGLLV